MELFPPKQVLHLGPLLRAILLTLLRLQDLRMRIVYDT
jgi:hypothetical protein